MADNHARTFRATRWECYEMCTLEIGALFEEARRGLEKDGLLRQAKFEGAIRLISSYLARLQDLLQRAGNSQFSTHRKVERDPYSRVKARLRIIAGLPLELLKTPNITIGLRAVDVANGSEFLLAGSVEEVLENVP